MPYESLSGQDRANLAAVDHLLRPLVGTLSRQLLGETARQIAVLCDGYDTLAAPALAQLADDDAIANSTDLGGAAPLTKAEFVRLVEGCRYLVDVIVPAYQTAQVRSDRMKAAGVNSML